MTQNNSVEEVVEELKNIIVDEVLTKDGQVYLSSTGEENFKQIIQQERQTSHEREREIVERIEEWCIHNAKTIYHNNGHREYVEVRELLELTNPNKD